MTTHRRKKLPDWKQVVADFRLWSFHVYYSKSYATEQDLTLRFAKALCASVAPIADEKRVWQWWNQYQRDNAARGRRAADDEPDTDE